MGEVDFLINLDSIIEFASEQEKQQIEYFERQIEDSEGSTSSSTTNKKNKSKSSSAQKSKWKRDEKVKIVQQFKDSKDGMNLEDSEDSEDGMNLEDSEGAMQLESSKDNKDANSKDSEDVMTLENSKDVIGEAKDVNLLKKKISDQIFKRLESEKDIEDIFKISRHINSIYLFPYIYI